MNVVPVVSPHCSLVVPFCRCSSYFTPAGPAGQYYFYGGNGYAFVTRHFLPRLRRHGVDAATLDRLMTTNPRSVFDATAAA